MAEPASPGALRDVLRAWAGLGVRRLVVEGGDGTVREVLGALSDTWGSRPLELAVLAAGKTNALAVDLGVPRTWNAAAALSATGAVVRSPLEVAPASGDGPVRRGFLFGVGAFADAVDMSRHFHAAGLFGGFAVGGALAAACVRTLTGAASDPWRAGRPMRVDGDEGARFLLLASTLERLPLGLKPFGPVRPGLKVLDVAAPPRRLPAALPHVLAGRERPWLAAAGYRRRDAETVRLSTEAPFILDGELFEGGELVLRRGAPVTFVVP